MTKLVKGFTCECGTWHAFPSYVFAHWDDRLTHTCPECKAVHDVRRGVVKKK